MESEIVSVARQSAKNKRITRTAKITPITPEVITVLSEAFICRLSSEIIWNFTAPFVSISTFFSTFLTFLQISELSPSVLFVIFTMINGFVPSVT